MVTLVPPETMTTMTYRCVFVNVKGEAWTVIPKFWLG